MPKKKYQINQRKKTFELKDLISLMTKMDQSSEKNNTIQELENFKKELKRGDLIVVTIPGDKNPETGNQKYRPAIVLATKIDGRMPFLKVQILSTLSNWSEKNEKKVPSFIFNNRTQYVQNCDLKTISYNVISDFWSPKTNFDDNSEPMVIINNYHQIGNNWTWEGIRTNNVFLHQWN